MYQITRGQKEDGPRVMQLIAQFTEASLGEYGVLLDPEKIQKVFDNVYSSSFMLKFDGIIVGILAGKIGSDICSDLLVYEEILWFVEKEHRRYGVKLLRNVMDWCREVKITRMTMSGMHNSKFEKLTSLYEKMGFKPQETRFVIQLD